MEMLLNTSDPIIILFYTIIAVTLIVLARKFEISVLPGVMIIISLALLIIHSISLDNPNLSQDDVSQYYFCIAYDLILLLLNFLSFLWIDDIVSKKKVLKSYDNSLFWFWDKL